MMSTLSRAKQPPVPIKLNTVLSPPAEALNQRTVPLVMMTVPRKLENESAPPMLMAPPLNMFVVRALPKKALPQLFAVSPEVNVTVAPSTLVIGGEKVELADTADGMPIDTLLLAIINPGPGLAVPCPMERPAPAAMIVPLLYVFAPSNRCVPLLISRPILPLITPPYSPPLWIVSMFVLVLELMIAPPLPFRLVTMRFVSMSKVALLLTVTGLNPAPNANVFETRKVPPLTIVGPTKLFEDVNISVPEPILTNPSVPELF